MFHNYDDLTVIMNILPMSRGHFCTLAVFPVSIAPPHEKAFFVFAILNKGADQLLSTAYMIMFLALKADICLT